MDYENRISSQSVHFSRYIASYLRICSEKAIPFNYKVFIEWLRSLDLTEAEVQGITLLSWNGKIELEDSAREFLR